MTMTAATIWRAVAEVLTRGISFLHPTAMIAAAIGATLGIVFEVLKISTKNRFPLSGVGMGLAFVLRFSDSWAMFLGAFIFWALGKRYREGSWTREHIVGNQETICAGVIAGGALMGIVIMVLKVVVFGRPSCRFCLRSLGPQLEIVVFRSSAAVASLAKSGRPSDRFTDAGARLTLAGSLMKIPKPAIANHRIGQRVRNA